MRPDPKKRIQTQGTQAPLGLLASALEGLNLPTPSPDTDPPTGEALVSNASAWKLGRVVLRRERAQRGGKTVIVVDDFAGHLPLTVIDAVARKIRAVCGCGGTVKDRRLEVQGDQPAKIRAVLEAEGFQVGGVR